MNYVNYVTTDVPGPNPTFKNWAYVFSKGRLRICDASGVTKKRNYLQLQGQFGMAVAQYLRLVSVSNNNNNIIIYFSLNQDNE